MAAGSCFFSLVGRHGPSVVDLECMPLGSRRCTSVGGRRPLSCNAVSSGNFKVSSYRLKRLWAAEGRRRLALDHTCGRPQVCPEFGGRPKAAFSQCSCKWQFEECLLFVEKKVGGRRQSKVCFFSLAGATARLPLISSACRWATAGVCRWAAEGRP